MEPLLIFGASGFARETRDIAQALGYECIFIAATEADRESWTGEEKLIVEGELDGYAGAAAAIGIGDNSVRRKISAAHHGCLRFVNLIHPDATFGKGQREVVEARHGLIICAGVRLTNGIELGDFAILNLNATIGHDVIVDDYVNVAPGANISGYVHIREGVWIGTNATINQGSESARLEVGANTVIGSGSVVVRDCEPDSIYVGIPAKKKS